ncbi:uncharacterized protein [Antedon mediterranea]|uniref:uncharacterized protein n=1 Tax=Antedon mediterranea TaxID=105859 RepID=UPI003AF8D4DF
MSSLSSSASAEDEHDIVEVNWRGVFENDPRVPAGGAEGEVGLLGGDAAHHRDRARAHGFAAMGLPQNLYLRQGRDWCGCGNCVVEEMWENRYCCQEVEKIMDKNKENEHNGCITTHPWFQAAILNPATLQIAYWQYASQYDELVVEGRKER